MRSGLWSVLNSMYINCKAPRARGIRVIQHLPKVCCFKKIFKKEIHDQINQKVLSTLKDSQCINSFIKEKNEKPILLRVTQPFPFLKENENGSVVSNSV